MFPRSELALMDNDLVFLDGAPDWLVPELRSAMHEVEEDGLGLRSLIERTEVPPRPWPTARRSRRAASARVRRAPLRRSV
jgi:hypothetical protein